MRKRLMKKQLAQLQSAHVKRPAGHALELALEAPWAITEEALRNILAIASRENPSPEAIAAKLGRELDNTQRTTVRDGIATIPVTGPLFRKANLLTRVSGATSMEVLAQDITAALEAPEVDALLFDYNSPGGMVDGTSELGDLMFDARGKKPMVAFVSFQGTSGAYWLASAVDEIVVGDTAIVGNLGVRFTYLDETKALAMAGLREIEIISSQTPRKAMDPAKRDGLAQVQEMADHLAEVLLRKVARNRDVPFETVLNEYGQGGVFVGQAAVDAGVAERISTYETLHAELVERAKPTTLFTGASGAINQETSSMNNSEKQVTPEARALTKEEIKAQYPVFVTAWKADGATTERDRLAGIDALAEPGYEALIKACKEDPNCTPETAAFRMKQAEKTANAKRLEALKTDEDELEKPSPLASSATDENGEVMGKRIAAQFHQLTQSA